MTHILVFLGDDAALPWVRVAGGVVTRGADAAAMVVEPDAQVLAVVPGEAVVVHWTQLPDLAPAQAAAAARMLAADVSAAPIETVHVALGPVEGDGWRMLSLVEAAAMDGWLARLAAAGVEAERMVPAPLLLPVPESGVAVLEGGAMWQVRGGRLAFAAEAELARLMIGEADVVPVADWEAGLAAVLAAPMLDLRQGDYARARRWKVDGGRLRRIAVLAGVLLGVILATQVAGILRFGFAADRAELQLADAARAVLPRGTVVTDGRAQVAARLAALGGDGAGFAGMAGAVVEAVRAEPGVVVHSLEFSPGGGMTAAMTVPADRDAVVAALAGKGFDARFGTADARGLVEMRVVGR